MRAQSRAKQDGISQVNAASLHQTIPVDQKMNKRLFTREHLQLAKQKNIFKRVQSSTMCPARMKPNQLGRKQRHERRVVEECMIMCNTLDQVFASVQMLKTNFANGMPVRQTRQIRPKLVVLSSTRRRRIPRFYQCFNEQLDLFKMNTDILDKISMYCFYSFEKSCNAAYHSKLFLFPNSFVAELIVPRILISLTTDNLKVVVIVFGHQVLRHLKPCLSRGCLEFSHVVSVLLDRTTGW